MIVTRWNQLSPRAQKVILAIAGSVSVAQVKQAKDWIIPHLANHPHLSTIAGGLFVIAGILFKPEVREYLGLKQEKKEIVDPKTGESKELVTTTAVVALPEGTEASGQLTTTAPKE